MSAARTTAFARSGDGPVVATVTPLLWILGVAAVLRLIFIGSDGFHNDVAAFESWALTLRDVATWQFYGRTTFADYPPGYFLVEFVLGRLYGVLQALHLVHDDAGYAALRTLVKLPAIAFDLFDAALIWVIARRFAPSLALAAAAFFAFNPAAIYESAYWGQIDSISWGLVLLAIFLTLRAGDDPSRTVSRLIGAWCALGFSLLIKPQAALIVAVLIAYAFATDDPALRRLRLRGTVLGIVTAIGGALLLSLLFHPAPDIIGWLWHQYSYGKDVYAYTSVNAFNLYAVRQHFWLPDTAPLTVFGIPLGSMAGWGIALVLGATVLIVGRYLQRKDDRAFLEAAMLVALGFFVLSTRMHERYIYGAFLLVMPLVAVGRVWLYAAIALSFTTLLNLAYSFAYQNVMETKPAGVDATDIWPLIDHPASLLNVAAFFVLGYLFLGSSAAATEGFAARGGALLVRARTWFSPREGVRWMLPVDHAIAALMTVASFVICWIAIGWPSERIFDEIYYPRSAEEYLKGIEGTAGYGVFEFTHPPLTKLLITLSMMLFGGLHGGNTAYGWRFLAVVCGAAMVYLIYAFGKRLTGSTLGASLAGLLLLADGFHFVQSRISTPEIFVATFSLAAVYAFYRLLIAGQVGLRVVQAAGAARVAMGITLAIALAIGIVLAFLLPDLGAAPIIGNAPEWMAWTRFVVVGYVLVIGWLVARLVVRPRAAAAIAAVTSYPEGTRAFREAGAVRIVPLDAAPMSGTKARPLRADGVERTFERDGSLRYVTPEGTATYAVDGDALVDDVRTPARHMWVWVWVLAIAAGILAASKWNGLVDWLLIWGAVGIVALQRFLPRPALYGNPFSLAPDLIVGTMIAVAGVIYLACYIPFFVQDHHNLRDLVALQHAMYQYHHDLRATHPYQSQWWQWPLIGRPISYYYHDFRAGAAAAQGGACCVAEILALPNPLVWWSGLVTIPILGFWAWTERNKGYALVVGAYLLQWLPWIGSPRIAFEYHFFPNLAMIVLANAVVLERVWRLRDPRMPWWAPRAIVAGYAVAAVALFIFFYPILAGSHIPWDAWHARMWTDKWI